VVVEAEPPAGWVAAEIAQPPLASGSGASFVGWRAWRARAGSGASAESAGRAGDGEAALVTACAVTPIPGWVEDMRAAVTYRTTALAAAAAERVVGAPVEARETGDMPEAPAAPGGSSGRYALRVAGAPEGAASVGVARTFVAFDGDRVATCFAVCAESGSGSGSGPRGPRACDASVAAGRIAGGTAPPRPGLVVGAVTWAVHHPERSAVGAAVALSALAVLAVAARRKPRSRI